MIDIDAAPPLLTVTISRPEVRNAVDGPTAAALADAFRAFEADDDLRVAVLTGAAGHFSAGADLGAIASGERLPALEPPPADAPLGVSRMRLSKPVIAAVEGYAVAGGLELAVWCDLRVAAENAVFGVFCRRWGVPLVDGGTWRLPRLVGQSRALDLILTGRPVEAREALSIGLADRVVPSGTALPAALDLARAIAEFPWQCVLADRATCLDAWTPDEAALLEREWTRGSAVLQSGEAAEGAARFSAGEGRHGRF